MRRTPRGFTLVELMVSVAIIGLLASIAIPNFQAMILHARRTTYETTFDAYRLAIERYVAQTGALPPADKSFIYSVQPPLGSTPMDLTGWTNAASDKFIGKDVATVRLWYDKIEPWRTLTSFGAPMYAHSRSHILVEAFPGGQGAGAVLVYLYGLHNFDGDADIGEHVIAFISTPGSPKGYLELDITDTLPDE